MDDIKYHVVVKQVIDVDDALYFTRIDRRDEKLRHPHPCHPLGHGWGARGPNREYGAVNIIKLSSETWYTIVNDRPGDCMMLYRSRIGDDLIKISHTCHLGLGAAAVRVAYEPGGMWCCGARSRSIPMI